MSMMTMTVLTMLTITTMMMMLIMKITMTMMRLQVGGGMTPDVIAAATNMINNLNPMAVLQV